MKGIPTCIPTAVEWAQKTRDPISVENQAIDTPSINDASGNKALCFPTLFGLQFLASEWFEKNHSGLKK